MTGPSLQSVSTRSSDAGWRASWPGRWLTRRGWSRNTRTSKRDANMKGDHNVIKVECVTLSSGVIRRIFTEGGMMSGKLRRRPHHRQSWFT